MNTFKRLLVGVETDPQVVGAFRALFFYALPLGVGALGVFLSGTHDPHWLWLVACFPLIRATEGYVLDQLQKPSQNATNPAPPAGEKRLPGIPAE